MQQFVTTCMALYLNTYFSPAHKDRYTLICVLNVYVNLNENQFDEVTFGGVRPLPDDSTAYYLQYLIVSINFIDTWLKAL